MLTRRNSGSNNDFPRAREPDHRRSTADTGLTQGLAELSCAIVYETIPEDVAENARQALLDWFGVTLSGSQDEAASILLRTLPLAEAASPASVSIVGRTERAPALSAALINGTASHWLDFDDVNTAFLGHCSVAIAGAVLALAEQIGARGREVIAAYVAGYEVACRVAVATGPQSYLRGWHSTGTNGTFGAAAACSHLLGSDPETTAIAFSLAGSQAAGLKSNIGTMAKSFHAGKACQNGLLAALLAANGFTAHPNAIEADQGFAKLTSDHCDATAGLDPSGWYLRENLFKYHASCYRTHSAMEGIARIVADTGVQAADVREIRLHISALEQGACAIPEPTTGVEVKFSLAHLATMSLLRRETTAIFDAA